MNQPVSWRVGGVSISPFWIALLISILFALWVEQDIWLHPACINDDIRNQAYWMLRVHDPGLFPHDAIADYFSNRSLISPGIQFLYSCFARVWPALSPLRISQFLCFPLVLCNTWFLYRFVENDAEPEQAAATALLTCLLFNAFIWTMRIFSGGLPRAFFYPLLFFFLWQIRGNYKAGIKQVCQIALPLALGALIYPPVTLIGVIWLVLDAFTHRRERPFSWRTAGLLLMSLGVILWRYFSMGGAGTERILSLQEALHLRELYPGGRIPLFPFPPVQGFRLMSLFQLLPHLDLLLPLLGGLVLKTLLAWRTRHAGSPAISTMLAASWIMYALAWMTLFYLYVPERYLQYTLPLWVIYLLAQGLIALPRRWMTIMLTTTALLICGLCWQSDLIHPDADDLHLMAFLNTLPKETMILAPPDLASDIPPLAERSVWISHEAYIPFHPVYFAEMKRRLKDWLAFTYAKKAPDMAAFLKANPVDYVIISKGDLILRQVRKLPKHYYHAFPDTYFHQLALKPGETYWLENIPDTMPVYRNARYKVVSSQMLNIYSHLEPR